jgi:hypothetical protein
MMSQREKGRERERGRGEAKKKAKKYILFDNATHHHE